MMSLRFRKLTDWFRNHFVFSNSVLFIWGLIFSFSFVEYGAVSVVIDFFTNSWEKPNLLKAVAFTYAQDNIAAILAIVVAFIAEYRRGRFFTIAFGVLLYILGLLLLWVSGTSDISLSGAMVFIGYGKSVRDPGLQAFLEYQLKEKASSSAEANRENQGNQERGEFAANIWWRIAWFAGSIAIFFLVDENPTKKTYKTASMVMAATYLLFLLGCKSYVHERPKNIKDNVFTKVKRVFLAARSNKNLEYPDSVEKYYWNNQEPNHFYRKKGQIRLLPRMPPVPIIGCEWLDKAAIIRDPSDLTSQEMNKELYSVQEVREVMCFVLSIFTAFSLLAYDLVVAAGNTFFLLQATNMKSDFTLNKLFIFKSILRDLVIFFCWLFKWEKPRATVLRMSAGMVCAIACCIIARQVELRRLTLIKEDGILQNPEKNISMGTRVLVPQFILLGLMEALVDGGRTKLTRYQVRTLVGGVDQPINEFLSSGGKGVTLLLVFLFRGWFKETVNASRLDRYYLMLIVLNVVYLCDFIGIFYMYLYKEDYSKDEQVGSMQLSLEEDVGEAHPEEADTTEGKLEILRRI